MKILLIEDEKPLAVAIVEFFRLERPDWRLIHARTVSEARELLASDTFDLCISDCVLPDGTACDLLMEERERLRNTPLLVMTGFVDPEKLQRVRSVSPQVSVVRKPFFLKELEREIRALIGVLNTN